MTTITTLTSTALGLGLALFMQVSTRITLNPALSFIFKIPLFMPYLVTAFVFWVLLYPKGYIGIIVQKFFVEYFRLMEEAPALVSDPYGIAIVICGSWMRFPYAFVIIHGLLQMLDPVLRRQLGRSAPAPAVSSDAFTSRFSVTAFSQSFVEFFGALHRLLHPLRAWCELATIPIRVRVRECEGSGQLARRLHHLRGVHMRRDGHCIFLHPRTKQGTEACLSARDASSVMGRDRACNLAHRIPGVRGIRIRICYQMVSIPLVVSAGVRDAMVRAHSGYQTTL